MANLWEAKDENTDPTKGAQEPEVVKNVLKEIKALGDNYNKNYEELNCNYNELKSTIDRNSKSMDSFVKEKIAKLTEDITTRQVALDAAAEEIKKQDKLIVAATERMDLMEIAMKRSPLGVANKEVAAVEYKDARQFQMTALSYGKDGAKYTLTKNMEVDTKNYAEYTKSFEEFMRTRGSEQNLTPEMQKALSVGIDPDGGYTVPTAQSSRVFTKLFESDPIRQLANVVTISTGAIEFPVDWDEAGYGWETESVAGAETTTPQFSRKRIPVHVIYAKPRATQTFLEDSAINVPNWLAMKVGDRFSRAQGAAFVSGDGIGKPRGFLSYTDAAVGTIGYVDRVSMGADGALTADGFITVKFTLHERYMNKAAWLMNKSTVAAALKLKQGTGDYIWRPGLIAKEPSTILGSPVYMSTTMPVAASDSQSVAYADWSEFYTIVDRLGITVQRDPYTVKPFIEFYTRARVGGDVSNYQAGVVGALTA